MVALALNTNLSSLNAQRHLENNRSQLGSSINRISSGRIEGASDGVTELTLTENIRADVVALQQGSRNLNDGTALVKTAEGALNEISGILLRLRSIASQSANGTIDDVERISTDLEYQASLQELDRIVATTEFNGTFLLDGTLAASQPTADHNVLQLGVDSSSENQFDLNNMLNLTNVGTASLGLSSSNITTQGDAFQELDRIVATTEFNGTFLLDGTLAASQPAADHNVLQLGVDSSSNNQFDLNNMLNLTNVGTASLGLSGSNITSQGDAFQALNALTTSIDDLIQARGRVGTTQIRIMHAFDNLKVQEENLTAAVSTIRDADFAEELTSLTKNQLLVQSAVAMVGQANLNPQAALTLLEGV